MSSANTDTEVITSVPSTSKTDVIAVKALSNSNTRTTGYKSKRWARWEEDMLLKALKDNKLLSEIKLLLSNRTDNAILKRSRDLNYSSFKLPIGDQEFRLGINRKNSKSISESKDETTDAIIDNKDLKVIVEMLYKANTLEHRSADIVENLLDKLSIIVGIEYE